MATNRSGCRSCSGRCGSMGVLSCVSGPLSNCGVSASNYNYGSNYPFYTGPCPDCVSSGCNGCSGSHSRNYNCSSCNSNWNYPSNYNHNRCGCSNWNHWNNWNNCGCGSQNSTVAMFTLGTPVSVEDGGSLPLNAEVLDSAFFEQCSCGVRIKQPGMYHVIWTLNVPSSQNLNSRMYLSLNGTELRPSGQLIASQADNTSTATTGQMVIECAGNSVLSLDAESGFCLNTACGVENVVTLTINRIH